MIDIYDITHLWRCSPAIVYNESRQLVVRLRLASIPDRRAHILEQENLGPEAIHKITDAFVGSRVDGFEELKIGGKQITTFEELLATGTYHELVGWCRMAVTSEALLSAAEIKNSLPVSATDSTAEAKPARKKSSTAKTAKAAKKS